MISLSNFSIQILDPLRNNNDELLLERALYRAFPVSKDEDDCIAFIKNHKTKRLKTEIPYANQVIYTYKSADRILAAASVSYWISGKMQLDIEGFAINKDEKDFCEALYLFNFGDIEKFKGLMEYVQQEICKKGISKIYATCSDRRVNSYVSLGFHNIQKNSINEINNNLLFWKLPN